MKNIFKFTTLFLSLASTQATFESKDGRSNVSGQDRMTGFARQDSAVSQVSSKAKPTLEEVFAAADAMIAKRQAEAAQASHHSAQVSQFAYSAKTSEASHLDEERQEEFEEEDLRAQEIIHLESEKRHLAEQVSILHNQLMQREHALRQASDRINYNNSAEGIAQAANQLAQMQSEISQQDLHRELLIKQLNELEIDYAKRRDELGKRTLQAEKDFERFTNLALESKNWYEMETQRAENIKTNNSNCERDFSNKKGELQRDIDAMLNKLNEVSSDFELKKKTIDNLEKRISDHSKLFFDLQEQYRKQEHGEIESFKKKKNQIIAQYKIEGIKDAKIEMQRAAEALNIKVQDLSEKLNDLTSRKEAKIAECLSEIRNRIAQIEQSSDHSELEALKLLLENQTKEITEKINKEFAIAEESFEMIKMLKETACQVANFSEMNIVEMINRVS